jgi:hypothetical protein
MGAAETSAVESELITEVIEKAIASGSDSGA